MKRRPSMPGKQPYEVDHMLYRCPKCDDSKNFTSLQLLRQHLEIEHCGSVPFIRNYDIYGNKFKDELQSTAHVTPMMSYSKEAKELERQLLLAKEAELQHRKQWEKVKYTFDQPAQIAKSDPHYYSHYPPQGVMNNVNANLFGNGSDMFQNPAQEPKGTSKVSESTIMPKNRGYAMQASGCSSYDHLDLPTSNGHMKSLWTHTNKDVSDLHHLVERLKEQLQFKDTQMTKANEELKKLTEDRRTLQRQVLDLSKENDSCSVRMSHLEEQLDEKDKLILNKQNELTSMSDFLHDTTIKESSARQRLEDYINMLIDRTERAEMQLREATGKSLLRSQNSRESNTIDSNNHEAEITMHRDWQVLSGVVDHSTPRQQYNGDLSTSQLRSEPVTSTPYKRQYSKQHAPFNSPNQSPVLKHAHTKQQASEKTSAIKKQLPMLGHIKKDTSAENNQPFVTGASPSGFSTYSVGEVMNIPHDKLKSKEMPVDHMMPKSVGTTESSIPQGRGHSSSMLSSKNETSTSRKHPVKSLSGRITGDQVLYQNVPLNIVNKNNTTDQANVELPGENDAMALEKQREWLTKQLKSIKEQERLLHSTTKSKYENMIFESEDEESIDTLSGSETESNFDGATSVAYENEKSGACSIGEVHLIKKNDSSQLQDPVCSRTKHYRDALYCVFMYLDMNTLSQVSAVCKEWLLISRQPSLWRRVVLSNARISSKYLSTISAWCSQLQILHLSGLRPRAMRLKENRQDYEKNIWGSLEAGLEQLLHAATNTLTSIKIVDCGEIITDRCLWLASCHCPYLERVAYVSETDPAGAEVIYSLGAGCRNITTLILHPQFPNCKPHKFNNKTVQKIAQSWPDLRVLCIGGVDVSGKGLALLGAHCENLEVLELDHMCEVNESTAITMCEKGLKKLRTIEFTFTPVTPKAVVYFKSACSKLKVINICIGISDYFEDTSNPVHRENYQKIVNKLKNLRKRPELKNVLCIRSDFG